MTVLEPYEKVCPQCKGKGFLDPEGNPWEGEIQGGPDYMYDYSKCWNPDCKGGILLSEEGQALLEFIKRHL
ncbi:unnamed protein product [marine sediment metagenome]|uniref:Uncharacterized protein n=1 Tax=marine sediment metagenome TaxID=412755 RepID=X0V318_9ZZZZ